jgi:hypothetical protein
MSLPIILSVASLIAWVFSFIFLRNYLRRRTDPEWILAEWKEEINKLNADMDAATDRNVALVEDRIEALKELIKEADRRIALSIREEDKGRAQEAAYAALGRTAGVEAKVIELPLTRRGSSAPSPGAGEGYSGAEQKGALEAPSPGEFPPEASPAAGPSPAELPAEPALPPGPRFVRSPHPVEPKPPPFVERVAELARAGFSSTMIAANLGVPLAEVELAIAIMEGRS